MTTFSGDATLSLPEFDHPPADPFPLLHAWLAAAVAAGVREPHAMTLATADATGLPSTRVVLLKSATGEGLIFGSHTHSRKGADLAARPHAAATFHWRETVQQLHVCGPVTRLSEADSDHLFADRPPAAQATTAASDQSRPLNDEAALRRRAATLLTAGAPIPRPADWSGYLLRPTTVEFWQGSEDRLHRRLRYDRSATGWSSQRLQP